MSENNVKKIGIILIHSFAIWGLCGLTMGLGLAFTTESNTIIIHAIAAPIIACLVSLVYFKKFSYTTPIQTAIIFVVFIIIVDFFLVALVINQSLEMFTNALGTWIPFGLIFIATLLTGIYIEKQ